MYQKGTATTFLMQILKEWAKLIFHCSKNVYRHHESNNLVNRYIKCACKMWLKNLISNFRNCANQ